MPEIQIPAICLLSLITDIIFICCLKKVLNSYQDLFWQKSYCQSFENLRWSILTNFYILKNFKNELIIKVSSLKTIFLMIKSGWIVNTSTLSETGSLRSSFSNCSTSFIFLENKLTSWSFLKSKKFMIFSRNCYWSKILLGRSKRMKMLLI